MTDRAELGARIAEAMGWSRFDPLIAAYVDPQDDVWPAQDIVTWQGYGIVDAWMREQGWDRVTFHDRDGCRVVWSMPGQRHSYHADTPDHDEPLAALRAVEKALLEASG